MRKQAIRIGSRQLLHRHLRRDPRSTKSPGMTVGLVQSLNVHYHFLFHMMTTMSQTHVLNPCEEQVHVISLGIV